MTIDHKKLVKVIRFGKGIKVPFSTNFITPFYCPNIDEKKDEKGELWSSVANYYQAQKFEPGSSIVKKIKVANPSMAQSYGRHKSYVVRKDWTEIKEKVMLRATRAKFAQHEELKKQLLETGDANLKACLFYDLYWAGDGKRGQNKLGKILMRVRDEINQTFKVNIS